MRSLTTICITALVLICSQPCLLCAVNAEETATAQSDAASSPHELEEARQLAASGRIEAAAAAYRRLLIVDPGSFDAHSELGQLLLAQHRTREAREHLRIATDLRPDSAAAHARLGQVMLLLAEPDSAEQELTTARSLDPNEPSVRYNLGRLFEQAHRDAEALDEYLAFLDLSPADGRANIIRTRVALYYENTQRLDDAVKMYQQILDREPSRLSALTGLADILYRRGKYDQALLHYEDILKQDPRNAAAHANAGFILRNKGRLAEAIEHYRRATEYNPTDVSSLFFLGNLHADMGDTAAALGCYVKVLAAQPNHPLVHYAIGKIYLRQGDREAAQREFDLHRRIQAEERQKNRTATTMGDN